MNTKITFVELVDLMAQATSTSKRMCELFLREFFSTVSQALVDGENVKIKGIGTFKVTQAKSRKGSASEDGAHSKVTFTPDKALAEALNQPFAQFETVFLDDAVTDEKLDEIDRLYPSYFPEAGDLPEPPDIPTPPIPDANEIPAIESAPAVKPSNKESVEASKPESKPEPVVTPQPEPHIEPEPKPKVVKPLMGTPIDGPSTQPAKAKPIPAPAASPVEEEKEEYFYRPEPRNVYTPTEEQISRQQNTGKYKRWLWIALAVLTTGLLIWGLSRCNGKTEGEGKDGSSITAVADSDSVADATVTTEPVKREQQAEPVKKDKIVKKKETAKATEPVKETKSDVVTDIVTDKIVLVTLAEKHYGSPWFWVYIYDENRDKISNPNNIKPGTRVVIPPAEKYGINAKDPASVKKAQHLSWQYLK